MKLRYSINTAGVSLAVFPSKKTTVLTEGAEGDAEDEEGDGVRNTGAAEEVARGDSQNQRHPNEEHRVIRLTHLSLSLSRAFGEKWIYSLPVWGRRGGGRWWKTTQTAAKEEGSTVFGDSLTFAH
jgi:hypothetical protein